ncbi:hypothetical protein Slala05_83060 [Streptomyces lavendulae subsp. lavendulae]|nr:hypothetical protein Slala05_83060 [Streptomyces lavendulae subsp. lavendulae]
MIGAGAGGGAGGNGIGDVLRPAGGGGGGGGASGGVILCTGPYTPGETVTITVGAGGTGGVGVIGTGGRDGRRGGLTRVTFGAATVDPTTVTAAPSPFSEGVGGDSASSPGGVIRAGSGGRGGTQGGTTTCKVGPGVGSGGQGAPGSRGGNGSRAAVVGVGGIRGSGGVVSDASRLFLYCQRQAGAGGAGGAGGTASVVGSGGGSNGRDGGNGCVILEFVT